MRNLIYLLFGALMTTACQTSDIELQMAADDTEPASKDEVVQQITEDVKTIKQIEL